ncbi:MAG: hypothetical protein EU532_13740 [Promethearchaeota archaeon]|nr:MAG: hypothetical protein EU532_13740 [Candidatus Lokiarchaeota archaeon]
MADLLREGYTMLNQACPNCRNPIFRSRSGDMFCPTCNKPVVFYEKNVDPPKIEKSEIEEGLIHGQVVNNLGALTFLYGVILNKIKLIADHLNEETELANFNSYIRSIHMLLKILHQLQDLKDFRKS